MDNIFWALKEKHIVLGRSQSSHTELVTEVREGFPRGSMTELKTKD